MKRNFDVLNVSELRIDKIVWFNEIWSRFEKYQQGENIYEYLYFQF